MKIRNVTTNPSCILRLVAISILLIFLYSGGGGVVHAQNLPPALGTNSPLSPTNKQTYQEVAKQYTESFNAWRANPSDSGLADRAKLDRNRLIFLTIDQIDVNFNEYQKKTRKWRAFWATLLDILEIGASTAISLSNGERAKTEIAEALGFVQLSRAAVVKNFSLRDTQILFNKMVAKRAQLLSGIISKTGQQDITQYPFEAAFSDLIAYYKAGTIDGALEHLNIDTGAEASQATKQLVTVTQAQADASLPYAQRIADLFKKAKDTNHPDISGPALTKLKNALKDNFELVTAAVAANAAAPAADRVAFANPVTSAADIDALGVSAIDSLYRIVGRFITEHPDKLQKLAEALKEPQQ